MAPCVIWTLASFLLSVASFILSPPSFLHVRQKSRMRSFFSVFTPGVCFLGWNTSIRSQCVSCCVHLTREFLPTPLDCNRHSEVFTLPGCLHARRELFHKVLLMFFFYVCQLLWCRLKYLKKLSESILLQTFMFSRG